MRKSVRKQRPVEVLSHVRLARAIGGDPEIVVVDERDVESDARKTIRPFDG